ncbi:MULTISPECIES: GatB/YqeY domain-containing protein [Clostridium]|uniref:Aspartyl-tRNA amidotransferase subunit B n=2 Tax=Clostridium TaxID=1485 RepID=A0A9W5XZ79_9CLOT|nr:MULTISPECIES: GatB/YqeY domain-containing protein [Clostridium]GFZ30911.1 aspartyl-tRNA amidotransferase subunit B [Clostridium zeae]GKU23630.1 aspartyl-tRNA amidotransferase subunit B [Clostridium folliculivorans]GKU29746.1 aspartyl-tRNA amidotransferase subunit B [Clostridium folliculivorans]
MPTIKERLQEDWKQALKARDKFKAETLSTARSAVLLVEKTEVVQLEDERVIEILSREVKQRRESMLEFEKGNRQDLVDKVNAEIQILLNYLPQQLSEDEILEIIREAAIEVGANNMKDMGKVMSAVRPKIVGRADGKLVSQMVKDYLNK